MEPSRKESRKASPFKHPACIYLQAPPPPAFTSTPFSTFTSILSAFTPRRAWQDFQSPHNLPIGCAAWRVSGPCWSQGSSWSLSVDSLKSAVLALQHRAHTVLVPTSGMHELGLASLHSHGKTFHWVSLPWEAAAVVAPISCASLRASMARG